MPEPRAQETRFNRLYERHFDAVCAYAWRRAHGYARRAKTLLADEPAGPIRDSLELAVDYAFALKITGKAAR